MTLTFDLSDYESLEELARQIEVVAKEKYDEAETIKEFDSIPKQWKYGYYSACIDVLRGIRQVKKLSNQD
jgi:hypothetical protein